MALRPAAGVSRQMNLGGKDLRPTPNPQPEGPDVYLSPVRRSAVIRHGWLSQQLGYCRHRKTMFTKIEHDVQQYCKEFFNSTPPKVHHPHPVTEPYSLTHPLSLCGSLHPKHLFSICSHPNYLPRGTQGIFRAKTFHVLYPTFSTAVTLHNYPPMKMEQNVSKRWHLNHRRWGITQKKTYYRKL
jgi:hypothetical protein